MIKEYNPKLIMKIANHICVSLYGNKTDDFYNEFIKVSENLEFKENSIVKTYKRIFDTLSIVDFTLSTEKILLKSCYSIDNTIWHNIKKFDKDLLIEIIDISYENMQLYDFIKLLDCDGN
jgi:hypothetical protein